MYQKIELYNFNTNIIVISFTNLMSKLIVRVEGKENDIIKQIKAIRNLEQLKICDLVFLNEQYYIDYLTSNWNIVRLV